MKTKCPHCEKEFKVPDDYLNRRCKCSNCKEPFIVADNSRPNIPASIDEQEDPKSSLGLILTVSLIAAALAGAIGFCSGMLMTRPQRSEVNEKIAFEVKNAEEPLYLELAELKKQHDLLKNKNTEFSQKINSITETENVKLKAQQKEIKALKKELSKLQTENKKKPIISGMKKTSEGSSEKFYVRIAFVNDTKSQPLSTNCRMWIRGFGDFYPVRQNDWKFGGTLLEKAGPFYANSKASINNKNIIYFYPDYSDDSRVIKIPLKYLPGMNPNGSVLDMLNIVVKPKTITFYGTPIKDVNGKTQYIFNRYTCKEITKTPPELKKGLIKNEVIGKWLDNSPYIGSRITIFGEDGKLFMEKKYNEDGSIGKEQIIEVDSKKGRVFQSKKGGGDAGEYYLIDKQGNLQLWDKEGIIWTAKKVK